MAGIRNSKHIAVRYIPVYGLQRNNESLILYQFYWPVVLWQCIASWMGSNALATKNRQLSSKMQWKAYIAQSSFLSARSMIKWFFIAFNRIIKTARLLLSYQIYWRMNAIAPNVSTQCRVRNGRADKRHRDREREAIAVGFHAFFCLQFDWVDALTECTDK